MDFLFSNFAPQKTGYKKFYDAFYESFSNSDEIDIAVGYVTADSVIELQKALEINNQKKLNLTIGMHYWDKFTKLEYNSVMGLNKYLTETQLGTVNLIKPFKFHGKLYSFSKNSQVFSGIIGSDNLSSIVDTKNRVYEASFYIQESNTASNLNSFIKNLVNSSATRISDIEITEFKENNPLLDGLEDVYKITPSEQKYIMENLTNLKFDIPIKVGDSHQKSNINVFHGKGRENPSTGLVKPRHWYEVEIIVPSNIRNQAEYPSNYVDNLNPQNSFTVVTDDGWKFECQVQGGNKDDKNKNKNFRSKGDLKTLGKWIKGRLENHGVLNVGDMVTEQTLLNYGRSSFTLTKTKIKDIWYLDFGL